VTPDLLLDSHVLLGVLYGNSKYGKNTRRLLSSYRQLHFSPLSIAELRLKTSVKGAPYISPLLQGELTEMGFKELPLTSSAANDITRFPELHHHDPFDRLLLAQAATNNLLFITADKTLITLGLEFVHDAYA
jgi:PIN domain nuclease of toxin-antitoxin system